MLPTSIAASPVLLLGELAQSEQDCACPVPPTQPPSSHAIRTDLAHVRVADLHTQPLIEDWQLVYNALADIPPVVLNGAAQARLAHFTTPDALHHPFDAQLAAAQLIAPVGTRYTAPTEPVTTLTAWMHVTNACNLDCPYCYVKKSQAHMSLETGMKAIDALISTAQRQNFNTLKIKYAGGEAALHYRLVQQIHAYAQAQARKHHLALTAVVLSNGTVMPAEFVSWLADTDVRLMLSVDGVGASHDVQRPFRNGRSGAFAALERNLLERLLPQGIRPNVCITVTGRTAATAYSAVEWAIQHALPFNLNFYRETSTTAKHRDLRLEEEQIIAGMMAAYAVIEQQMPVLPFLAGLLDRVQFQSHSHTCGVNQNYVVITHEGRIAQCQMHLQHAATFDHNTDLISLVATGPIPNLSVDDKAGCCECLWRYRCTGGCPLVTLRATGRVDVQSPNCAIYQALLPAALRLEGLRLLKVHAVEQM